MIAELARLVSAVASPEGGPVVEAPAALEAPLQKALEAHGWHAVRVDRAPVYGRDTLLHALYQACELPGWFGFNWDALLDCLADWSWRPAAGHALVFRDLDLLESRAPEVARAFLAIVEAARGERGAALRVVRLVPPPEPAAN
jgi:RNAse (barnase) inhibitor barstar